MNDRFIGKLVNLTYGDVVDWVDELVAARGFNYRDRVGGIFALDDGYAARVTGTDTYVTNLYADSRGEFRSVCTCPVRVNCKHAAALAFVISDALKAGRKIPHVTEQVLCLDRAAILASRGAPQPRKEQQPAEVIEDATGRHYLVRPAKKHWFSEDYRNPVPRNAPDFARMTATSPISFPHNRFVTSMWPCERCVKPDDMVKFLSSVPLVGREIDSLRTYGPCAFVDERSNQAETAGKDADDEEDIGRAYRQIPEDARFGQRAVARYAVSLRFSRGGTFEIDGDTKPGSMYLAMNQIHWSVRPQEPLNVNLETFFGNLRGKTIERIEVASSLHAEDPYGFEVYEKPVELVDGIVFWLEGETGLRFAPEAPGVAIEVVDGGGCVKTLPWGAARKALYTDADVCYDSVTGCVSQSRRLLFGMKGFEAAEGDCVRIRATKELQPNSVRCELVCMSSVRRELAAILALAAFKTPPEHYTKWGTIVFSREEWMRFLGEAEKMFDSPMMRPCCLIAEFTDCEMSASLLRDLRSWSQALPESVVSILVDNIWGQRSREC